MNVCGDSCFRQMTETDIFNMQREYWQNIDYGEAINARIRERYTESQEFAILRQRDDKPDEYAEYYEYCETCKAYVRDKKAQYGVEV